MRTRRLSTALATCAVALAATAAPAAADSIVYLKDGNVWLTSPDGSRGYQVTFDGGYDSPSQADDGTIVALREKRFVRIDRSGRRLNEPVSAVGSPVAGGLDKDFYGPYEPRVSPDGKRIAYWYAHYSTYYDHGCQCTLFKINDNTAWTYADRFTAHTESDYYRGITQPEWLTNDRLLATYPLFWMSLWTYKIGTGTGYTGNAAQFWAGIQHEQPDEWGVRAYRYFGDAALSPDGSKLAMSEGGDASTNTYMNLASVDGPVWAGEPPYTNDHLNGASAVQPPALRCGGEMGVILNPTWAPDSDRLALSLPDGVHVLGVPDSFDCAAITDTLLVPGGAQPDWGPADVNMAQKPSPPVAAAPAPQPGAPRPGLPSVPGGDARKPVLARVALKPAAFHARRGTTLRFKAARPARLTLRVRRGSKRLPGAIRTAAKPGANRLRFTGRIGGRRLRPGRYVLEVRAKPVGGGSPRTFTARFRVVR